MFGLYRTKTVKKLAERLRAEYGVALARQKEAAAELKEQNRLLQARVLQLESERVGVSDALTHAVAEGERIKEEGKAAAENERRELKLLAEKCRLLLDKLVKKYPDSEDAEALEAFLEELRQTLGTESVESGFDMDEVLSPKEPLDLGKLCKELGLMEDDE